MPESTEPQQVHTGTESETEIETETEAEPEPDTCSLQIVTEEELFEMKKGRLQVSAKNLDGGLYACSEAVPTLANRQTYYLTVQNPDDAWYRYLHTDEGYTLAALQPENCAEMMADNKPVSLYLFSDDGQYFTTLSVTLTDLPVLTITTNDGSAPKKDPKKSIMSLTDADHGSDSFRRTLSAAEMNIRGATSADLAKTGFKLDLKNEDYSDNARISLLGMRRDDDWILVPMYSEEAKVREMTAWNIWEKMGYITPARRYVEVILNNEYYGLYMLMERFDEKTLSLDSDDKLFKATTWEVPTYEHLMKVTARTPAAGALEKKYPEPEDMVEGSWTEIAEFVRLVFEADGSELAEKIADTANVENMLDYWLFVQTIIGEDNRWKNAYYAVIDGIVHVYPWDLDISFGMCWGINIKNYLYQNPAFALTSFEFECGKRLIKYYPGGAEYVKKRWDTLKKDGVLSAEGIKMEAEKWWNMLQANGSFERNLKRWPETNFVTDMTYFNETVDKREAYLDIYIENLTGVS